MAPHSPSLSFIADPGLFMITPDALTLLPNETSAVVSITMVDNEFAEYDNTNVTVSADSTFGSANILITILDDERECVSKANYD